MTVLVTLSGIVSPTTPVSYMTHASVPARVVSLQSSPLVRLYCLPLPSPCALGQQVNAYHLLIVSDCLVSLLFSIASLYTIVWTPIVLMSLLCHHCSIVITYTCY